MQGIEFQIINDSDEAAKGLEELSKSLSRLKNSIGGSGTQLSKVADGIRQIKNAIKDTKLSSFESGMRRISESLKPLGEMKFTSVTSFLKQINTVSPENLEKIAAIDFSNLKEAADAAKVVSGVSRISSAVKGTKSELPQLEDMGTVEMPQVTGGTQQELDELKQTAQELKDAIDNTNSVDAFINAKSDIDILNMKLGEVKAKIADLRKEGGDNAPGLASLVERAQKLQQQLDEAVEPASSATERFGAAVQKVTAPIKKLLSLVKKLAVGLKDVAKRFLSASSGGKGFGQHLKGMISSIARIAKYRAIRAALKTITSSVKEGVQNLVQYSAAMNSVDATQANKTMSEYASTLQQVKNTIGAAVMPVLSALLPVVNAIATAFMNAANAVNQFFSALRGQGTFTRAKKNAVDYAESLGGATGAAKELKKTVMGFDELNLLNDQNSGGSGADGTDYSDMFEEVAIEPLSFDSWGEAFSAFLDKILDEGIPKLKSALASAAAVINEFSANLAEMFTFPGVYDKVVLIGTEVANAFNDFVNLIDWGTLGTAIGAGLNLALGLAVSFIYTFNWLNLGASIAEMFNKAVEQIDWKNVGALLWAKFKIAIETVAGFLLNLDMSQLWSSASAIVIGLADSITETIYNIDWRGLADQTLAFIVGFFVSADWAGMADSVFEAIGAALGGIAAFLTEIIGNAWDEVVDWWHDVAYEDGQFTIEGLFDGILEALKNIGQWIQEHIFQPIIDGFKKAFGIASPSTVMKEQGGFVISGLLEGLKSGLQPIMEFFNTVKTNILNVLNKVTQFISGTFANSWETSWAGIKNTFRSVWNGIVSLLESAINSIITGINWLISKLNTIQVNIPDWVPAIGGKTFGIDIPAVSKVTLPKFASGGFPSTGELFIAREAGAEMVGSIGGKTAVANNDQIVDAVKAGVYEAVASAINNSNRGDNKQEIHVYLDSKEISNGLNRRSRMYGAALAGT